MYRRISKRLTIGLVVVTFGAVPLTAYAGVRDGRSPDTKDAAAAAHATQPASVVDGRSPDTRDAAAAAHSAPTVLVVDAGAFDWTDAGIGAAGGFGLAAAIGGGLLFTGRAARRKLAV